MQKKSNDAMNGWRILWKYLSVYKSELTLLSVLGVFSAIANGSVPYIMGKFLDAILTSHTVFAGTTFAIPFWALMLVVWGVVQLVAIGTEWGNEKMSGEVAAHLRGDYLANAHALLLKLKLEFYKDSKTGEISQSFDAASEGIQQILRNGIAHLTPQFLSIIIGIGFSFFMNASLATVLLVGIVAYVLVLASIVPQLTPLQLERQKAWRVARQATHQAGSNMLSIKQFGTEEYQKSVFDEKFLDAVNYSKKSMRMGSRIGLYQRACILVTQITVFIASVYFIQVGSMTIGQLLAFNGYAAMMFKPLLTLGHNWQDFHNGFIAIEHAEKILSEKPEDYSPVGSVKDFKFTGAIKFNNVSFGYKKGQNVLDGVSFETKPGEMVALVGESGAGKSTLIDLISGYYFPTGGRVTIDGHSTKKIDLKFLRSNIAIVPQEVALFHDTIKMNIAYGSFGAKDTAIKRAAEVAHADIFIENFPKKYETVVGERGVKLSVGQKQRIAIARAILRDPKILILDEPTSALDSETEKLVTDALNHVMAGRTTFVIAHRLSTVRRADKILVLERGKIIESGTHEELMAILGGSYRHRYELHIGLV